MFSSLFIFVTISIILSSCSNNGDELIQDVKDVEVKLDYAFFDSGSMMRNGESVYISFYNDFVKTKKLAPKSYSINFLKNSTSIATVEGIWGNKSVNIKEGEYIVSGVSKPQLNSSLYGGKLVSDSLYLIFNENVSITPETQNLTLQAKYDCYLLLFSSENIQEITDSFTKKTLPLAGSYYYLFVQGDSYVNGGTSYLSLEIKHKDGTRLSMRIGDMNFKKGMYYYFNDMTNSFDIEPMPNGNQ